MKKILTLIQSDLRQIFRDPMLAFFLFAPLLLTLFVRLMVPAAIASYPVLATYQHHIMMGAGIQTAIMFGFITSFIMLDEKDENVLQVIRVLPISPLYFIVYRLAFATVFSAIGALLVIYGSGIAFPGHLNSLLLAIQYGLTSPFITLIIATFAHNKVEGMAYFKAVDLVLLLPILSFFIPGAARYVFALVPSYWTYSLYEASISAGPTLVFFAVGTLVYAVAMAWLFSQFRARVFDR